MKTNVFYLYFKSFLDYKTNNIVFVIGSNFNIHFTGQKICPVVCVYLNICKHFFFYIAGVTYLISNLASNTTYLLRVASKNPAGLSDWTTPLEVKTHAREPYGLPPSGTAARIVASSTALFFITALLSQLSQVISCNRWTNDIRWTRKSIILY